MNYIEFKGKVQFAQNVKNLNQYDKYSLGKLYISSEAMEQFVSLGVKNELKKDDKGYFVRLSRPKEKELSNGERIHYGPPKVTKDGIPSNELIGDGSSITAVCELYGYNFQGKPGKAIRLYEVKIDELVPFVHSSKNLELKPQYNW